MYSSKNTFKRYFRLFNHDELSVDHNMMRIFLLMEGPDIRYTKQICYIEDENVLCFLSKYKNILTTYFEVVGELISFKIDDLSIEIDLRSEEFFEVTFCRNYTIEICFGEYSEFTYQAYFLINSKDIPIILENISGAIQYYRELKIEEIDKRLQPLI